MFVMCTAVLAHTHILKSLHFSLTLQVRIFYVQLNYLKYWHIQHPGRRDGKQQVSIMCCFSYCEATYIKVSIKVFEKQTGLTDVESSYKKLESLEVLRILISACNQIAMTLTWRSSGREREGQPRKAVLSVWLQIRLIQTYCGQVSEKKWNSLIQYFTAMFAIVELIEMCLLAAFNTQKGRLKRLICSDAKGNSATNVMNLPFSHIKRWDVNKLWGVFHSAGIGYLVHIHFAVEAWWLSCKTAFTGSHVSGWRWHVLLVFM